MSLELNKAAAAVLTAGLVAMGSGFVADLLTQKHGLEENAYPIAVEGGMGHGGEAPEEPALESVLPLMASADAGKGEGEFRACAACHNIAEGAGHKVGPNLWGVVGRDKHATDFANYSGALPDGSWGYAELNAFLANPKAYAPGTSMGFGGIDDVADRANLIAYLRSQGSSDYPLPSEDEIAAATAAAEEGMAEEAPAEEMASEESAAEGGSDPVALVDAADPAKGERLFGQCQACHVKDEGASPTVGPNLWGVVGRAVAASDSYDRYSDAFHAYGEGKNWDVATLWTFLEAPMDVVPGTMMAFQGLKDEDDRAAVIAYLRTLGGSDGAAAEEPAETEEAAAEEPAAEESAPAAAEGPVAMIAAADPSAGEAIFAQCGACHVKAAGATPTVGPNLWNVVGRDIASAEGFTRYSGPFKAYGEGEKWTYEKLWEFLEAPMQVVPGTMMAYPGVKDEGDRAALIHYLNTLSDSPLPIE